MTNIDYIAMAPRWKHTRATFPAIPRFSLTNSGAARLAVCSIHLVQSSVERLYSDIDLMVYAIHASMVLKAVCQRVS